MRKECLLAVLSVSLAAALFGCTAASNTLEVTRAGSPGARNERVIIGSRTLGRKLTYGDVAARREGLLLHVQVELKNLSKNVVNFEYRWEWTDAEGFQLGDTLSIWQPGAINGKERKLLTSVGPGPSAENFRLYVRKPGG